MLIIYKQEHEEQADFMNDAAETVIVHWFDISDETKGLTYVGY